VRDRVTYWMTGRHTDRLCYSRVITTIAHLYYYASFFVLACPLLAPCDFSQPLVATRRKPNQCNKLILCN